METSRGLPGPPCTSAPACRPARRAQPEAPRPRRRARRASLGNSRTPGRPAPARPRDGVARLRPPHAASPSVAPRISAPRASAAGRAGAPPAPAPRRPAIAPRACSPPEKIWGAWSTNTCCARVGVPRPGGGGFRGARAIPRMPPAQKPLWEALPWEEPSSCCPPSPRPEPPSEKNGRPSGERGGERGRGNGGSLGEACGPRAV